MNTTPITENKYTKPPSLTGYTIDHNRAKQFRDNGKLLTMRLETSRMCNLRCIYCHNDVDVPPHDEISFCEMQKVIYEARQLSAESVVIIGGGEPLIYPSIRDLISCIHESGMVPVIITNGLELTKELCYFLWDNNTSILLKCDSLDEERQDHLCGKSGSHSAIMRAINLIMELGLNEPDPLKLRVGLSFVVTRINYADIFPLWKFCRENNFFPNFEEFIPRGRGLKNYHTLILSDTDIFTLKKNLLQFDQQEYGYDWLIHSPLPGHGCLQPICSIYVTSNGDVRPCADIEVSFSNIRASSVSEIISTPFFQRSRNIEKYLQGKCFSCEYGNECIGCRGNAFSVGIAQGMSPENALCSPDPLCLK